MKPLAIVDRYARSIFELAEEAGKTNILFQELAAVSEAMSVRPELLNLLQNPLITRGEKEALIQGILGPETSKLSERFLNLLVEKNRIDLYPLIVARLRGIIYEHQAIAEAAVVSARELHPSIIQLIQKALERATMKKVLIQTEMDSNLLGGIQIRLGNRLIDGTLRTKLHWLDSQLRNVKV